MLSKKLRREIENAHACAGAGSAYDVHVRALLDEVARLEKEMQEVRSAAARETVQMKKERDEAQARLDDALADLPVAEPVEVILDEAEDFPGDFVSLKPDLVMSRREHDLELTIASLRERVAILEDTVSRLLERRDCPAWLLALPEPRTIPEGHTIAFAPVNPEGQ